MRTWIILFTLLLAGCSVKSLETKATTNGEIKCELLFVVDGIKVYRFEDGGKSIYFTDARGAASWTEVHSTGKSSYTTHHRVETVKDVP